MAPIQVEYKVKSSKELKPLEKSMDLLLSYYSIRGDGTLIVSNSDLSSKLQGKNIIDIEPKKDSFIEEIFSKNGDAKGKTIKASPNYQYLKIKDDCFFINYEPSE